MKYDIAILGGGPGGYATALRAVEHGLRVVIVEADRIGGTCLHRGCIPSKALLHIAHLADQLPHMVTYGLATSGPGIDRGAVGEFRDTIVGRLHRGLEGLLERQQIAIVHGWGRVTAPGIIEIADGTNIEATNVVIATGSSPMDLPMIPIDGDRIICSDQALQLNRVPQHAVIVGAGAIGVEFASMWRSFGSEVVLVEGASRILPLEDVDSSSALTRAFKRRGIDVRTSVSIDDAVATESGVTVDLSDGTAIRCDQLLVAIGRKPATSGTGLAELGVLDDRGFVAVDGHGRTAVSGLWAIGDAVRSLALAHAAFAEGFVVADTIAGRDSQPVDHSLIPRVTYSSPEVASVGLSEAEARVAHENVTVTTSSFAGNAKAAIEGVSGHVKLVCADGGHIVGAHIVGPAATELIAELGMATAWEALASEIGDVVHAHPSLAENIRETALAAAGMPFHAHVGETGVPKLS